MPRIEKQVMVLNKKGLCTRASAAFVDKVKCFKSVVTVVKGSEQVNGGSIMALCMLRAHYQTSLLLIVEGEDAQVAMKEFEDFFAQEATKVYPDSVFVKHLGIFLGLCLLLLILCIIRLVKS